jgi:diguanylate cyclase (GGDEF)-like protein
MPQEGRKDAPIERARFAGSLRGRLLLAALAVIAPLLLGAGLWILLLSHSAREYRQLASEAVAESDASVVLLQHLNEAEEAGIDYAQTGSTVALREFRHNAAQIDRELSDTGQYDEPAEVIAFVSIRRPWNLAKEHVAEVGKHAAPQDTFEGHMHIAASGLERLMTGSQDEVKSELAASERAARLNWLLGLSAVALALVLAAFLATRLSRSLVRPLEQLAQGARSLGAGHLGHRVEISSPAELREVGTTFNAMAEALGEQREELERHAFADSLTGLANRALFEDRTRHALERVANAPERVAVLVLDLDGFKLVNDGLGHSCGDALLKQAAARMSRVLRPSDMLARLGSDEFAVLLESVRGLDDTLGAAERLREAFRDPFALKSSDVSVSVSVGVAMSTEGCDETELLRRADLAMYRVKAHGRDACEFFDPAMDDQAAERLEMVNALRWAVERDELVVHYQPIMDLESGDVRAAEALLRWQRPGHGLVPPLEFIPLAEQTGAIVGIGEWVLNAACAEARGWARDGLADVPVTVNVSARQLLDPRFEAIVAGALAASELAPARLILEVTESSVLQNADVTISKLDRISSTGVRIALDDFGEGYSSLGQLRELPIDILKIARPFVRELTDDDHDPALVRGIIELARSLGLRLVAEGIESPEQEAILRAFDCQLGQGFLFARPLEADALRALLRERASAYPNV